jgi:hypothetical protein
VPHKFSGDWRPNVVAEDYTATHRA